MSRERHGVAARVLRRVFAVTCVLVVAIAGVAAASAPTSQTVGLKTPYTLSGCTRGDHAIDPINVVWYGSGVLAANYATTGNVGHLLSLWGGWSHNDYQSPVGADSQFVATRGGCWRDDTERASGCAICNRDHVRLFYTLTHPNDTSGNFAARNLYVVGDAHHDQDEGFWTGCTGAGLAGHIASTFDGARDRLAAFWRRHAPVHYHYWGNTRRMKQCDGSYTHSDGRTLYASVPSMGARAASGSAFHPVARTLPSIIGSPIVGNQLAADPGVWSPAPTGFTYAWCVADLTSDSCAPIPGATADTWTPQTSDVGHLIAVLVRPAGASPEDAVLSATVKITGGSPPANVTPPSITWGCPTSDNGCPLGGAIQPGTWTGAPTLLYIAGTCQTDAECATLGPSSDPATRALWVDGGSGWNLCGGSVVGDWEATIIARNAAGEVIYPVRTDVSYQPLCGLT